MRFAELHPRRFFLDTWSAIDAEALAYRNANSGRATKDALLVAYIFSVVAVSLVLQGTLGDEGGLRDIINFIDASASPIDSPFLYSLVGWLRPAEGTLREALRDTGYYPLIGLCYWAIWRIFGFLVIPLLAILSLRSLRGSPLGLTTKGFGDHVWVYGLFFVIVMAPVFVVSFSPSFSSYYPFYDEAHRSWFDFLTWELFYIAQFFSLEFFFRGFMLQPLRRIMGSGAIFAMMVPYVLIHLGKPLAECLAAIIAGIVLGTLALRTRSIWGGILIHVGVAVSMDILCIWQVHFR